MAVTWQNCPGVATQILAWSGIKNTAFFREAMSLTWTHTCLDSVVAAAVWNNKKVIATHSFGV